MIAARTAPDLRAAVDDWQAWLRNERRALVGALLIMAAMLLVASTAIYYIERRVSPDDFDEDQGAQRGEGLQ